MLTFRIHCSRFDPYPCTDKGIAALGMARDGVELCACDDAKCKTQTPALACIRDQRLVPREPGADDDYAEFQVEAIEAGTWNFLFPVAGDADADLIPDAIDACPTEPEDLDGREDTDGCPEVEDADGDGLEDFVDACPTEPEDLDGREDTDGCPEVEDADGDGILDATDACPTEPEDIDGDADTDGCPETEPPPAPCADFDADGRVTLRDIALVAARVGARPGNARYRTELDLNGNRRIDLIDVLWVTAQVGRRCA